MLFRFDHIPEQIEFRVKLDRTLLPNTKLGDYIIDIHCSSEHQDVTKPIKLVDGVITLDHAQQGKLDINITLHDINELTMVDNIDQTRPLVSSESNSSLSSPNADEKQDVLIEDQDRSLQTNNIPSQENVQKIEQEPMIEEKDESNVINSPNTIETNNIQPSNNNESLNMNSSLSNNNNIIEQPIEITRRIIHIEKPRIVEIKTYKEIHEYIREEPQYITKDVNTIVEDGGTKDISQLSEEEVNRLKQYANIPNNDLSNVNPTIEIQKEQVQLAPEIRELSPQMHEKEIVYEQPIEIERLHVEKIKPIIHEEVKIVNENIIMKAKPQTQSEDTVIIDEGHKYYSNNVDPNIGINDV